MSKKWRYLLVFLIAFFVCNKFVLMYWNQSYSKEEIDKAFEPITAKYGTNIVYEINENFFSPLDNPPIPAGPPKNSNVKSIRHRVLLRYPDILQKAFQKYPIQVIKNNLKEIYFAGEIDADGLKASGTYDPFRKIVYLVDNGWQSDDAVNTFHHEFSSLLLNSRSFFINPWTDQNPKSFKYYRDEYDDWSKLRNELDIFKKGSKTDYEKGFLNTYGQTTFENDFNEYSAMIFTDPEKFEKIMGKYPRVHGKFKVWLEFYQKIDPIFTEAYLFGNQSK